VTDLSITDRRKAQMAAAGLAKVGRLSRCLIRATPRDGPTGGQDRIGAVSEVTVA
jgi:hypothetical protein